MFREFSQAPIAANCFINLNLNKKEFYIEQDFIQREVFLYLKANFFRSYGRFDFKTKKWLFPLTDHDRMVEHARNEFSDIIDLKPLSMTKFRIEFLVCGENKFSVKSSSNFASNFTIDDFIKLVNDANIEFQRVDNSLLFDLNQHQKLLEKVIYKFPKIDEFTPIPEGVVELFKNPQNELNNNVDLTHIEKKISPSIFSQLKEFQTESVLRAIQHKGKFW
jgi:hypothetical protein